MVSVEEEDLCRRRNGLEMACRHDDEDHDDGGQMMLKLLLWIKETVEKDSVREVIEARVRRILTTTRSDDDVELSMITACLLLILLVFVSMIFCFCSSGSDNMICSFLKV